MKTTIPEALKEDMPHTLWGKVLSATPVVMTVVATMLAGLSSSEMTRAQYSRSLAAQQQSKAGDQWNFFQGKKLRGVVHRNTIDMISSTSEVGEIDEAGVRQALGPAGAILDSAEGGATLQALKDRTIPAVSPGFVPTAEIASVLKAVEHAKPDDEIQPLLARVDDESLAQAVKSARDQATALDGLTTPIGRTLDGVERSLAGIAGQQEVKREFTVARLMFHARRYDAEARINQVVAELYELQVRKSNASAERHHVRSQRFFYGMLAAQMGVIVATFAMAARKRNFLWSIAAVAGVIAVGFAVYVYLYV
ncbi:MAG: hypothetical protein HS122_20095 [Opitutaceae bacterium]|nr:hypothetical protein [Opitutaceae bacterium]